MSAVDGQLALGLGHRPAMSRADFVIGDCNRDALAAIDAWPDWPSATTLLSGPEGAGKTHLVHIWSEMSGATIVRASDIADGAWELNEGQPIAVEDIDLADEISLFHLLNRARESQLAVLLTTRHQSIAAGVGLKDLASRLRAARPLRLLEPDDAFLRRVLVKHFSDRQLAAPASLLEYLLRRMERTYAAAAKLVADLDELALATGRPIGRQLAAAVLSRGDG